MKQVEKINSGTRAKMKPFKVKPWRRRGTPTTRKKNIAVLR